jgi:general secretion pathway protein D
MNNPLASSSRANSAPAGAAPAGTAPAGYPQTLAAAEAGSTNAPTPANDPRRKQSDQLLWNARRALAVGDVRRAIESVNQAKSLQVRYEFHEDSPAKVDQAIQKYGDLAQRSQQERETEGYRQRLAQLQLQQAEDLLRWRDFDEAERLANEAKRRNVPFGPYDNNPDSLLKRIAEARRSGGQPKLEALPGVGATPTSIPATAPAPLATLPGATLPGAATDTNPAAGQENARGRVLELVRQARAALNAGDLVRAEQFAAQADGLQVPDSAFSRQDDRTWLVRLEIEKRRRPASQASATSPGMNDTAVRQTSNIQQLSGVDTGNRASQAVYDPQNDATRNQPASAQQPLPVPSFPGPNGLNPNAQNAQSPNDGGTVGSALLLQGEDALRNHDFKTAAALFREAAAHRDELDPAAQQRLQDRLQWVATQNLAPKQSSGEATPLLKEAAAAQQLKLRQTSDELNRQLDLASKLKESDPKQAAALLEQAKGIIDRAGLDGSSRDQLLKRLARKEEELQKYISANSSRIALEERNRDVKREIEHEQNMKVEVQEKLAKLVDEFNELMDQRRYAEAELVAKKAFELAPKEPVVVQLKRQAAFVRANENNKINTDRRNDSFVKAWQEVETASIIDVGDENPVSYGMDAKKWKQLSDRRGELVKRERKGRMTDRELEIQQRLKTPVSPRFNNSPLADVISNLGKLAGINIYLDPRGLAEEGVDPSTPITIDLTQEIMLKSALSLILEPLHLSYVIKDEVLKITSEQLRDNALETRTYNVADLVIPIPNFVPNGRMGLAGALADAQQALMPGAMGGGGGAGGMGGPLAVVASSDGSASNAAIDPRILAQFGGAGGGLTGFGAMGRGGGATGFPQNVPFASPAGPGGGVQPDFDSLIELITATVAPTTWSEVGGNGAVKEFATNLSLVISQTQEVHEQIADLLEQLRRLQDLQVTIEVRFINLQDNFYEMMGVQFDANINTYNMQSGSAQTYPTPAYDPFNAAAGLVPVPGNPTGAIYTSTQSATFGVAGPPAGAGQIGPFSQDLSIPFRSGSYTIAQPAANLTNVAATGAGALGGATLGFAILSDIETYFFIQAVQNDDRTNVLQAPKVTLFNGQQAFVSDTVQSPFVISVIPVVGDFAAAQQPVIVVLSEGTFLTVQAVVSSDRRYVRLTVVPFFSHIGKVNTFTFTGSSSTTRSSSTTGPSGTTGTSNNGASSNEGTTVQLPQFAFTTVTTTVSVPDGGTVLLGGIKRLNEERKENGVPILGKIPYLQRLFNNISTARNSQSLMMMVTPRIIIQEEEEDKLGTPQTGGP